MKYLILGVVLVSVSACATPTTDKLYVAQSGCCKERNSESAPWYKNGLGFDACEARNNEDERDSIFQASGKIWWDLAC